MPDYTRQMTEGLRHELEASLTGEVRFDSITRALYSTDASPGPSGLRSGAVQVEREFPEDALGPAHSALLRARRLCADPQALSPLFLPGERRTRARLRQRRCICDATALARTRLADTSTVRVAPCAGAVTVSRA